MIIDLTEYKLYLPLNALQNYNATITEAHETRALYKWFVKFLGAEMVETIADDSADEELLLKVKCPTAEEYGDYRADHILFTYLHFDENITPEKTQSLISSGFLGIAYEWVGENGRYPLLDPMSKLTGLLFYQRSVELLSEHKGVLAGSYIGGLPGANILILGMGRVGTEVLKCALLNRLNVTVVARNSQQVADKTRQVFQQMFGVEAKINLPKVIVFDNDRPGECKRSISELMPQLDIIINGAVRRTNLPKEKLDYLIDRSMISQMQPNSIVCDATACDRDFIEEKVGKLRKYFERISEVSVILDAAGNDSQAEILVLGPQMNIRVHSVNEDMRAAFETALNKAERSLRKTKNKLFDKKSRRRNVTIRRFTPEELADEPEDTSEESLAKIPIEHVDPEVMTLAEAREKLDRVKEDLVVFVNPKTDEINLLHHNRDGKVELVELNGTLLYHPSEEVIELAGNQ